MFDRLAQDVRFSLRALRRAPGFAAVAILTLGLGIGSTTAIFSVIQAVLLRPLPYPAADRLVYVRGELASRDVFNWPISQRILLDMRERTTRFSGLAGLVTARNTLLDGAGDPVQLGFAAITPNLFEVLGVEPAVGRGFTDADAAPLQGNPDPATLPPAPVILSHRLWQTRFGGDRGVLDRVVEFGGTPARVVGVMPQGFELYLPPDSLFSPDIDVWTAPRFNLANADRRGATFEVIGRLADGATAAAAQGEMDGVVRFVHEVSEPARGAGYNLRVVPMQADVTAEVRPVLLALAGAVAFVLLIACANVSNLLLVRGSVRAGEMAVRAALGGTRTRLVCQLLTESAVLALLGAALGLGLARLGIDGLLALGPPEFPRMHAVAIDTSVLLFTLAASLAAALVFGTLPALSASRGSLAGTLSERGRTPSLGGRGAARLAIVVAEVALSVVLLIGAGLMLRSFVELQRARPGFDTDRALTFELQLTGPRFGQGRRVAFVAELRERLAALPGVAAVSAASDLPLHSRSNAILGRYGTEEALADDTRYGQAQYRFIERDYVRTMGTRLVAGRVFEDADYAGDGAAVVLIDRLLAARLWPDESPIGRTLVIRMGPDPERMEVVGVVDHQRARSPALDSKETVYFTTRRGGDPNTLSWVVRAERDPMALAPLVRAEVAAMDPTLPVSHLQTMADAVRDTMAATRFALVAIGVFAVVAVALALVGLYGVLAYGVRRRTAEIGLRLAFGAGRRDILGLVVRQAMWPIAAGVVTGLVGAFWLTTLLSNLLIRTSPTDPATFAGTSLLFAGTAALASLVPALRAIRVDPARALRSE